VSDARDWIEETLLAEHGYPSTRFPDQQLEIKRPSLPTARVLCVGLGSGETLEGDDVDAWLAEVPNTRFIVATPTRRIGNSAYERAEERGICVAGLGELVDALDEDADISQHVDSQERYERKRLIRHRAVTSIKRRGRHAYEVRRRDSRPLTIIATNHYEFTADNLYSILEQFEGIDPDLIVVTNPSCHGFSSDSKAAAAQTGIPIILFNDFLADLGTAWT
jgi:hypothetical protein